VAFALRRIERKRALILLLAALLGLVIAIIPLRELIFTRISDSPLSTESFSINARTYLAGEALSFFREQPLSGVGVGAFIVRLSQRVVEGYLIEPVHNVFLLAASELGIAGVILLLGLVFVIGLQSIRARRVGSLVFSALLAGLLVISLFDHSIWSLAPGRMLFGLALGLWAGQLSLEAGTA